MPMLKAMALKHLDVQELHSVVSGGECPVKPDDAGIRVAGGCQDCNPIAEAMGGDAIGAGICASREGNGWGA